MPAEFFNIGTFCRNKIKLRKKTFIDADKKHNPRIKAVKEINKQIVKT